MKKAKHLVVGNWKKNPSSLNEAKVILSSTKKNSKELKRTEVVVCPPFPYLSFFKKQSKDKVSLGAQNVFWEAPGSVTGEISPEILKSLGVEFVILGHSERRALGETDEIVAKKVLTCLDSGLKVIVCIGEKERDSSGAYLEVLSQQIRNSLNGVKKKNLSDVIVAYEPIWAIGKEYGEAMKPEDVHETVLFIKKIISEMFGKDWFSGIKILYGGAVNHENAGNVVGGGETDGLLIGRESLNIEGFKKLLLSVDAVPISNN
jgi:triosephosphate isomerase